MFLLLYFRHKLNCKRNKVDNYSIRKPNAYQAHHLKALLSKNDDYSDDTCKMPLSKSLLGGNMNVLKTRMLVFVQPERVLQGVLFIVVSSFLLQFFGPDLFMLSYDNWSPLSMS